MSGRIISINISKKKGMRKNSVNKVFIKDNYGIEGDAHASSEWHRQISLLSVESIKKMQDLGLDVDSGDFAENITTKGLDLLSIPIGTKIILGNEVEVELSQIGKECHTRCAIYYQAGDCVMPNEGVFVKVLKGGILQTGDRIIVNK